MENTNIEIEPIWKDNYVAIAMSSSEEYFPYLSVCLQSLVEHTSSNTNYDIVIFTSSENEMKKDVIITEYTKDNISVRFYNPASMFESFNLTVTHPYFSEVCYYRIAAPLIMKKYSKIIFTDIDICFLDDIQELYNVNITNAPLAACLEPIWKDFIENNETLNIQGKKYNIVDYSKNTLKLKNPDVYYNTGVVVINTEVFNSNNYFEKIKKVLDENYFIYQEQDALNYILNEKIIPLDNKWNFEVSARLNNENERLSAGIIHYLGWIKPWKSVGMPYANIWWKNARKSPFYELLIFNLCKPDNKIRESINYRKNVLKYWRYKLLSKILFGKKKEHYVQKKTLWKSKIRTAKQIRGIK